MNKEQFLLSESSTHMIVYSSSSKQTICDILLLDKTDHKCQVFYE